ncbi:hypothetical protein COV11_02005 [Candidatus Woesearchaeota archaeon CG10_big_fil_rev_8_21_14_0_10_30_7]|nr:MAG: hypothetical protein COV11_02005 [Candidatus Woesearchaeota archaeon CG10_big_fil_rev_8_21_14_0_10_30_7]
MKTKLNWNEAVKKWDVLIAEHGGNTLSVNNSGIDDFFDSLEERATEEYLNIKKLFVDPAGDVSKKYNLREKTLTTLLQPLVGVENVKEHVKRIEHKVVERCVNRYLISVKQKIEHLKQKYTNTEKTYEKSLELITSLRIEYINRLWFADLFEQERAEAISVLGLEKETINERLSKNDFEEAQAAQKRYLMTEKKARQLEQGRDNNALTAVNNYNQLVSIYETYQKARVFCNFLQKTTGTLEQTHNELVNRWEEYQKAGTMRDVVDSLRLTEVLKNAEETFKNNFSTDFPLIKKAEETIMEKIETPNTREYQNDIYQTATNLKKNVMGLFP